MGGPVTKTPLVNNNIVRKPPQGGSGTAFPSPPTGVPESVCLIAEWNELLRKFEAVQRIYQDIDDIFATPGMGLMGVISALHAKNDELGQLCREVLPG